LRYVKTDDSKGVAIDTAAEPICHACPLRERCTDGRCARHVTRSLEEDLRERAREVQTTEAYQKALRKRQVWVEPRFGAAKDWHQ
jgi:adenine-specific DNA glycosylase